MAESKEVMNKFPSSTLVHILFFVTSLIIIFYALLDLESLKPFLQEDGFVENIQAIFYLFGAVVWIYAFIIFKPGAKIDKRRRIFYFLFMGFFLFLFLEEISYGQRIFGITTPEGLKDINLQDETNLHNIGSESTVLIIHILHAFLFALLGIIIPFLNLGSERFGRIFKRINFPIVNTNLIICFGISLNFYYEPGIHWSVPFRILCLVVPIMVIFSGKFKWFLSQFKYPRFQIFILAVTGFLMIALNIIPETQPNIKNYIAWETRELFIAMSLFFFAVFEAQDVRKKKSNSNEKNQQAQDDPKESEENP